MQQVMLMQQLPIELMTRFVSLSAHLSARRVSTSPEITRFASGCEYQCRTTIQGLHPDSPKSRDGSRVHIIIMTIAVIFIMITIVIISLYGPPRRDLSLMSRQTTTDPHGFVGDFSNSEDRRHPRSGLSAESFRPLGPAPG